MLLCNINHLGLHKYTIGIVQQLSSVCSPFKISKSILLYNQFDSNLKEKGSYVGKVSSLNIMRFDDANSTKIYDTNNSMCTVV